MQTTDKLKNEQFVEQIKEHGLINKGIWNLVKPFRDIIKFDGKIDVYKHELTDGRVRVIFHKVATNVFYTDYFAKKQLIEAARGHLSYANRLLETKIHTDSEIDTSHLEQFEKVEEPSFY